MRWECRQGTPPTCTDTYLCEWKTSKVWTGCRRLIVTLADGTRHHADLQFK